jgi:hypothetical protein
MIKFYLIILFNLLIVSSLLARVSNSQISSLSAIVKQNGIIEPSSENLPIKVLAYPNPTKDRLFVESECPMHSISVYNLLGQKVKSFSLDGSKKYDFSVSDLPSGTYILSVQTNNQNVNQKFTKID